MTINAHKYLLTAATAALAAAAAVASQHELKMPVLPEELTAPAERAGYLIRHYWDAMDWDDNAALSDEAFIGEHIATWLSVFEIAGEEASREALGSMVADVTPHPGAVAVMGPMVTDYLLDCHSPVANEELFVTFADAVIAADWPDAYVTVGLRDMAMQCRPGTLMPDVALTMMGGTTTTLHTLTGGVTTLVMFYEAGCNDCRSLITRLDAEPAMRMLIADRSLQVVAIATGDTLSPHIPYSWESTHAAVDGGLDALDELYALPRMPTLYLLGADNTIILKNPSPNALITSITGLGHD